MEYQIEPYTQGAAGDAIPAGTDQKAAIQAAEDHGFPEAVDFVRVVRIADNGVGVEVWSKRRDA